MYIIQYASSSSNKRKILPRYQRISCAMDNSNLFLPILQWEVIPWNGTTGDLSLKSNSSISPSLGRKLWTIGSEVVVWMVAKGNYLCEVFEKKVPIIIQAQMGKLTNCIFLLFDGTNVHVPIPIAILATAILATWLGLYRFYFGYKKKSWFLHE